MRVSRESGRGSRREMWGRRHIKGGRKLINEGRKIVRGRKEGRKKEEWTKNCKKWIIENRERRKKG